MLKQCQENLTRWQGIEEQVKEALAVETKKEEK
jgi:hypothetical protein